MSSQGRLGALADRAYRRFHPDARRVLVLSLAAGAGTSLWWIDFNLYLVALGLDTKTIGIVSTIASLAGGLVAFPASAASDRVGRRVVLIGWLVTALVALGLLLASPALPVVILAAALWSAGNQASGVVMAPYLTEHSEASHRNELFAIQFATSNLTNVIAALLGGVVATGLAAALRLPPGGPDTYRIIMAIMAVLMVAGLLVVLRLSDDRPSRTVRTRLRRLGEPAAFPAVPAVPADGAAGPAVQRRSRTFLAITVRNRGRFAKLVLPGFLISIGAGQVIPFLNLFIQHKFGLDLASLNAVFAFTSLGTVLAILAQPWLARRFGQLTSVVLVQGASIPFLLVLGFSPILWTVIAAMMVRNSLMNAGNPIFNAFSMEQVEPVERATLSAAMSVLWQIGWVIGGTWYAALQAALGFDAGYTLNFATIIVLYTVATILYWVWFRAVDRRALAATRAV